MSVLTYILILFPEFNLFLNPVRVMVRHVSKWIGRPTYTTVQLDMCKKIIAERRAGKNVTEGNERDLLQRMIDATLTEEEVNNGRSNGPTDEDSILKSNKPKHKLTDQEVAANGIVMFVAGSDTTSALLGFLFHVLVNRPDIQDEMRKEVIEVYEKNEKNRDHDFFSELKYMDSVIYETLRYFPPLHSFGTRMSATDFKYKDITIPAGVGIEFATPYLHFDPDLWDKPKTFDPLRFFGDNKVRASHPAFQGFGAGPRNCLGSRFAIMSIKITTSAILRKFRILPGPRTQSFHELDIDYKPLSQNPKKGVFVRVVPLDQSTKQ
jgi:cytochrome P450